MKIIDAIKANDAVSFEKLIKTIQYQYVLHLTIARDRLDLSRIAIETNPDLIFEVDYPMGNSPLMYAIKSLKLDMVKLFDVYPQTFTIPNGIGELPLITAIKCGNYEIVAYVYEKYPEAILWRNEKGQTPLHVACRYGASQEIIQTIYTESQDIADNFGNFPIHLCDAYYKSDEGSFVFLAKKNIEVLSMKNEAGNTPVHMLAMFSTFRRTYDNIAELFTPAVLNTKNNVGMLAVHIAALFHNLDLILKMLSVDPSLLYKKAPTNKTIFSLLYNCSNDDLLQFFTFILSGNFEVTSEAWKFFPKNFKNLEHHLHLIDDKYVYKCIDHITSHAKYHLRKNLVFLYTFTSRSNIRIHPKIIQTIVLKSL